ncbi:ribonuclease HI [Shewanella sp. MBTL60-007]|uniref:ribonuclease HI n=1 Tax=Shewanella sp. MBTL60-007 TaxID=2815911 RepID=UPI001BC75114|nr:ribonuclease HI [Shewanella sp. MBTL60-007]GIU31823.1 ribonuclease H [Shewanella sp. MBTL60-007]
MKTVKIYSDGSCLGNGKSANAGGYGVVMLYGKHKLELSEGYLNTTNNRMEMLGAIAGLEMLKVPCKVELYTDSQYVIKGMNEWIKGWKAKGWMNSQRQPVKNRQYWERLDSVCQRHQVNWHWVKGHSGHPENERCDLLAKTAAETATIPDSSD